ncbi:MAG TPA: F0F1 ATP synthase subunit B [Candidatus Krumholzibacteria bacterium]|nr:F0F1 ATP synthase subunit B [Candidatus Krumholzibacteria bacterium]
MDIRTRRKQAHGAALGLALLLLAGLAVPALAQHGQPADSLPEARGGAAAFAEAGGEHAAAPSIMNVDPGLMIWTVITFVILLVVLRFTAWKPLIAALEAREQRIREAIAQAEKAREEGEGLLARYRAQLQAAKEEAQQIIEAGKTAAERLHQEILDKARVEAEESAQRARREMDLAVEQAKKELWEEATRLSTLLAEKILERHLDDKDHRRLVEQVLEELRGAPRS